MSIQIEHLSYAYRLPSGEKVEALKEITCTIATGDFVGIMGPTGSGKTTLLQLIAGLRRPTGGRIRLNVKDINAHGYNRNL